MISKYSTQYHKEEILAVCQSSRQSISKALQTNTSNELLEMQICEVVSKARKVANRMGARAIFYTYDVSFVGVNKFEQLVSQQGLNVPKLKRRYIKTTQPLYEVEDVNLINGLILNRPRQLMVGDITYLLQTKKTYYIFTLKDAYSGFILGLHIADNMKASEALITLKQALKEGTAEQFKGTIHHTDAGSQYKSKLYKAKLTSCKMKQSIAENCLQNGIAEQLNGLIKNDYLSVDDNTTLPQIIKELDKIKQFLNTIRKVKSLGNKTPKQFEIEQLLLPINKRKTKTLYDFENKK
jgi:putative transposase